MNKIVLKVALIDQLCEQVGDDMYLYSMLTGLQKDVNVWLDNFNNLTIEQLQDILSAEDNKLKMYKIYMCISDSKIPPNIKQLLDGKIKCEPESAEKLVDIFFMFEKSDLLQREDAYQIFSAIIEAPKEIVEEISYAFKPKCSYIEYMRSDFTLRKNFLDFITAIINAKGKSQARCAMRALAILPIELEDCLEIVEKIASCEEKLVNEMFEVVSSLRKSTTNEKGICIARTDGLEIINILLTANGYSQAETAKAMYIWFINLKKNNHIGEIPLQIITEIASVKDYRQADFAFKYVIEEYNSSKHYDRPFDEQKCLSGVQAIVSCETEKIASIVRMYLFRNICWSKNIPSENVYSIAGKLASAKGEAQAITACRVASFMKKAGFEPTTELIEKIANIENQEIIKFISYVILDKRLWKSKHAAKYVSLIAESKNAKIAHLLAYHIVGDEDRIKTLSADMYSLKGQLDCLKDVEKEDKKRVKKLLEESGLGYIENLDDEQALKQVETIVIAEELDASLLTSLAHTTQSAQNHISEDFVKIIS